MELQHPTFRRSTFNPEICTGKPCIRGMRFPVSTLLGYLAGGMSMDKLLSDFPFLERADILDAIGFAALSTDEKYVSLQLAAA